MTKNMENIFEDVISSLATLSPMEKRFIFGYPAEGSSELIFFFASYITFEFIKYSYDKSDPEYPLRHFLKEETDDERMLQSRIVKYVLKYKKEEIKSLVGKLPKNHKFSHIDMNTIKQKTSGYRLTEMNFFEHQNIHDLEIIKSIVEKRIISSKKIPNTRFREIFEEYDLFVKSLKDKSKGSDKDMVFFSIAFFTLEWHYSIEMLYQLAGFMEKQKISEINRSDLVLLCKCPSIESIFGGWYTGDSRMILERIGLFMDLFNNELDYEDKNELREIIKETLVLGVKYKNIVQSIDGGLYKDWFARNSSITDWASFLREGYDVFSIWEEKQWTNKKIKNMRYLLSLLQNPTVKQKNNQ